AVGANRLVLGDGRVLVALCNSAFRVFVPPPPVLHGGLLVPDLRRLKVSFQRGELLDQPQCCRQFGRCRLCFASLGQRHGQSTTDAGPELGREIAVALRQTAESLDGSVQFALESIQVCYATLGSGGSGFGSLPLVFGRGADEFE